MALKTRAELKAYLETGDRPTEEQLHELLDAMVLKSELGENGDLDPYPAGDGSAITDLSLPNPLPALDGSALTGISLAQYNDLAETPSYATSTTFTLSGDQTGYFDVNRRIRVLQDTGYVYTHVKSRSYSAGSDTTTVETTDPLTSVNLVSVGVSAFTPAAVGGGMTAPMIGWPFYAQTGGSATAYTLSLPQLSVVDGATFVALIHTGNTGAATLNVNGGGAKSIKLNGADPDPGALATNRLALFSYNPSSDVYEAFVMTSTSPSKNQVATKTGNYTLDPSDLAAPLIVPIDISSGSVDITELSLGSMSGWVRYVVVNDSGLTSDRKARVLDSGSSQVWVGYQAGDFFDAAYDGSSRFRLAEKQTIAAAAYLSAVQSIATGALVKVLFDTEEFDIGGNFASGTFTVPTGGSGLYAVHAALVADDMSDGHPLNIAIAKNGSSFKSIFNHNAANNAEVGAGGSAVLSLADGDTIEIHARVENAANDIDGGQGQSWVQVRRLP